MKRSRPWRSGSSRVHPGSGAGTAIAYVPADRIVGLLDSQEYGRPPLE